MKVKMASVVLIVSLVSALFPMNAAAEKKNVAGALFIVGGLGTMLGAYSFKTSCPAGYSTHTFQGLPTQCVKIWNGGSDVREASTGATLKRKNMLYGGAGATVLGAVLIAIPSHKTKGVKVSIAPHDVLVSKTFNF